MKRREESEQKMKMEAIEERKKSLNILGIPFFRLIFRLLAGLVVIYCCQLAVIGQQEKMILEKLEFKIFSQEYYLDHLTSTEFPNLCLKMILMCNGMNEEVSAQIKDFLSNQTYNNFEDYLKSGVASNYLSQIVYETYESHGQE